MSDGGLRPTLRAADAAAPRVNVGGISAQHHAPAMGVGRRRRAADAIVGRWWCGGDAREFSHAAALKQARALRKSRQGGLRRSKALFQMKAGLVGTG